MNKILFFTFLALPVVAMAKIDAKLIKRSTANVEGTLTGTVSTSLQEKGGWIRIDGEAAKGLYDALTAKAKNNQGEAGPDTFFKKGKSYWCYFSESDKAYACVISITNSRQGLL
jgi:hypothetical protein